ncbi:hypothetical protein MPTK1_2g16150 [Marchantia polymorpha subsp. ruderalis]|uniref:Uncharacterized protein n=1 Tax=Marchantia polymorpha TaxID=3197 RepID=A0A2R6W9U5_MARPO|nr:hypothetical protein MARPO_0122s0048 [Marchantia polymorpha]BBN02544.1 hypothetical protein Mp_2g16150 [Marchantia polymorpha subsp. ruderalis]PTQ30623.1 hypothetical protein MARPO_0122s0048 [Marchantia polymorpha]PTQ30624.1 hypothetical protein MARPO_0122s0048 [Marchantia polymorpha]BBN02545.1 hypothetical protein Mp_2g16150 [Marchantia polymorpha subsp. ruderalis]|eukprot:PTQ30622.1 hypothetical protein MARPO_0122s0048 [Marchantia polymorpha]
MLALETMAEEEITGSTKSQARQTQDDGSSEADLRPTQNDGLGRDSRGKAEINNAVGSSPHLSDSKSVDSEAVKLAYEKRLDALQQQLRVRDSTMVELADENESLSRALSELKVVVKETMTERERLADKIKQQQKTLQSMQASFRQAEEEVAGARRELSEAKRDASDARREANEAKRDANDARREATEAGVALADAKAEVWAIREAAKGKALGEDERRELEGALRALSSSSQRAAQEAGLWKEKASSWKGRAESLNEELENKAKALASAENELALAQQYVKDAGSQIQEAKHNQEVAETALEQLRQESDLRAQRFNVAVKAAVGKIQSELERERDMALQRIEALQVEADGQASNLKEANEAVSAAMKNLEDSRTRISELEEVKQEADEKITKLQEQVDYWQTTAETAGKRMDVSREVAESLTNKVVKLETRCDELTAASDSAIRNAAIMEASLKADISRLKSAVAAVQNEKQLLQIESSEKILKATAEQIALRAKLSDLEGQSRMLRAQTSDEGPGPVSKFRQGLDNLGLEGIREERLQRKDKHRYGDVEKNGDKRSNKGYSQSSSVGSHNYFPNSWTWLQDHQDSLPRGRVSRRSLIVLIYIVALHIMVMVSFTQRSQNCVDMIGEAIGGKLPGR